MKEFTTYSAASNASVSRANVTVLHIAQPLWCDPNGFVLSVELMLLATVIVIGLIVGHTTFRDVLNSELSDISGALQDLNQSYTATATDSSDGSTIVSSFLDRLDHCDQPGDPIGAADNCIVFNVEPRDEGEFKTFDVSEVGSSDFTSVNTGFGGSVSGTLGAGGLNTGFTTTTDTGQILGTSGNTIRFRESPDANGTFTTTFDDPLTNVEFFISNIANDDNFVGNFTVTLSDGTVLNNAAFMVLPDTIAPNSTFGEFTTIGSDRENLQVTTIGGNQFVSDPTSNGPQSQAAGRIVFTGIPPVGNSPTLSPPVGISSISFERFGGPTNFSAFFGFSGQTIIYTDQ